MKILTLEQEYKLLKALMNTELEDSGAARLVFYHTKETDDILEDVLTSDVINHGYVIKVCLGADGWNQSKLEIDCYKDYSNCGSLAEIFAYGAVCEIMEYIDDCREKAHNYFSQAYEEVKYCGCCDYEDQCEVFNDFYNSVDAEADDEYNDIFSVLVDLNGILGFSSDNLQIGRNMSGKIVAYDYGYEEDSDYIQCSEYSDTASYDKNTNIFLEMVCEMIQNRMTPDNKDTLSESLASLDDKVYRYFSYF